MSYLNNLYEKPPIHLVDGVVKDETLINFGFQIETAFDNVGDAIGNLYGNGAETTEYARYFNSISSAIGNIGLMSPDEPFEEEFESYEQVFSPGNGRKEFVLDLIADPNQNTTTITDQVATVYTWVATPEDLDTEGQYTLVGRSLMFFKVPTTDFTIVYNGTYPSFMPFPGYSPNVYPSPALIESGSISKPLLELTPTGRYRATIYKSNKNNDGTTFGSELTIKYNPLISAYVSPVGDLEVPTEYVNAWIKDGGTYRRLSTRSIFLLSDTQIEIDTDEEIDLNSDTIIFSIANVTISTMLSELYSMIKNHNHDRNDIVATMDHSNLINLIPSSSNPDINYSKSSIINNDHPEYLHREGFANGDSGSYNNALLGDLLIASTDPASLFDNVDADSNSLLFGSSTDGVSVRYRSIEDDLFVYHAGNGVTIHSLLGAGKTSVALDLNTHQLFNYRDDLLSDHLAISSDSGRTLVLDKTDPSLFADMEMKHLYTDNITLNGILAVIDTGAIQIGNLIFSENNNHVIVTSVGSEYIDFQATVKLSQVDIASLEAVSATITNTLDVKNRNSKIIFSDNGKETSLTTLPDAQLQIESELPLSLKTSLHLDGVSGRDDSDTHQLNRSINGISFSDSSSASVAEYSALYVSSQGGAAASPSQPTTFLEMHYPEASSLEESVNGLFLLRTTRVDQIEKGVKYSWKSNTGDQRIDDLTKWPRAKLAAGFGDFYSIKVGLSNLDEKDGVKFGEFNNIYVTGSGGNCPSGLMILESLAGVALVASGASADDCTNVSYSSLILGDMQSRGSVSVNDDISAGRDINAGDTLSGEQLSIRSDASIFGEARVYKSFTVDGDFNLLGAAKFNSNLEINGFIKGSSSLEANNLTINGTSSFNEIARFEGGMQVSNNADFDAPVIFHDRTTVDARLTVNELSAGEIKGSTIEATDTIFAKGGIDVISNALVHGNMTIEGSTDITGTIVSSGSVYAEGVNSTGDLNVSGVSNLEGDFFTKADVVFTGAAGSFLSNVPTVFGRTTAFNGDVTIGAPVTINAPLDVQSSVTAMSITSESAINVTNGGITATGDILGGSLTANGSITSTGVSNLGGNVNVGGNLVVSGFSNFDGDMITSGSVSTGTDMTSGGRITSKLGFEALNQSASAFGDVAISGAFSIDGTTIASGKAEFTSDVAIGASLQVSTTVTIGSSNVITIGDGSITIGDNGVINSDTGIFNHFRGTVPGNEISPPTGSNPDYISLYNSVIQQPFTQAENLAVDGTTVFDGPVICGQDMWVSTIRRIALGANPNLEWVDIISREAYYAP